LTKRLQAIFLFSNAFRINGGKLATTENLL
jgi:hypothetical protein